MTTRSKAVRTAARPTGAPNGDQAATSVPMLETMQSSASIASATSSHAAAARLGGIATRRVRGVIKAGAAWWRVVGGGGSQGKPTAACE